MSLPGLLNVDEVLARYRLRDRRAARRLMDEIGAFKVATKLYVREDALKAYEDALAAARKGTGPPTREDQRPRAATRAGRSDRAGKATASRIEREPLPMDWWREPIDGGATGTLAPNKRR